MSPSLYDLLDVEPTASTEEIREAWKRAIADLDPTDRRFRAYNDAAGVLLDPEQRAAYDAELAAEQEAEEPAPEPETDRGPDTEPAAAGDPEDPTAERPSTGDATTGTATARGTGTAAPSVRERLGEAPPQWLVGAAAVLALIVVAATVWVMTWPGTFGASPEERQEARAVAADSVAAAERIAPQVLSYDHRNMGDDRLTELQALMTPSYADEWSGVQKALRKQAKQQKAVVTAAVRASAVSDISADGGQAEVLVFVDQLVQKSGVDDTELTMWATLRLIRDDGTWLLEKICTTDPECA